MPVTVETRAITVKTRRETTIHVTEGTTLMELFEAIKNAEGGGYKSAYGVCLRFRED